MCRSPAAVIFSTIKLLHYEHLLAAARSRLLQKEKKSTKQQLPSIKILIVKAQLNKSAVLDLARLDFNELHFGFAWYRS